ncbi:hypothetical protein HZC30_08290 [Candidatus Woesearchaeota archaeon]|nr:hypothetical protein [Candidatus Woesearchaeota archaeon]
MQTKNNLVRKIMSGVSGLALLVGLEGCGTTIYYLDQKTNELHDCRTNEDYPVGHPCNGVVAEYNATHKSWWKSISSTSNSSGYRGSRDGYEGGAAAKQERDRIFGRGK